MNRDQYTDSLRYEKIESRTEESSSSKGTRTGAGSGAFYILLAAAVIAPLVFWPSAFIALDAVKTVFIIALVMLAAILYGISALRRREITIPGGGILLAGVLVSASIIVSAILSNHFMRSFFGQGYEYGTASFLLSLFVAGALAFSLAREHAERTAVMYVGMIISFFILFIFHAVRMFVGPEFMSLGILGNLATTVFGNWYSLGAFAMLTAIIASLAATMLPLSKPVRAGYSLVVILSLIGALIVNNTRVWQAAALVFLGIAVFMMFKGRESSEDGRDGSGGVFGLVWVPVVLFIIVAVFAWKGTDIVGKFITDIRAEYVELTLPPDLTFDVISGALKDDPVFGAGPNRFSEAYIMNKPKEVNVTEAWNADFNSGFGTLPSFIATQGALGGIAWLLFLVALGIGGAKVLSRLPRDPHQRFILVSSYAGAVFLWITAVIYTPSHVLFFFTFLLTGLWAGSAASCGLLGARDIRLSSYSGGWSMLKVVVWVLVVIGAVWGVWHVKKFVALAYFGSGVRELTVANHPDVADQKFRLALALDTSDVYWQARAEAALALTGRLVASASGKDADQGEILKQIGETVTKAVSYAKSAVEYDPLNYFNYLSEARVYETAASLRIANAYENAVKSYEKAISRNPNNPAIYLNMARLHASMNKTDEALKTVGSALNVKSNYLDAIFLLSQIEAARGNLRDAITAAKAATELNPGNALLWFQQGLLQYTNKDYLGAAGALEQAVKIQPDYANAKYFLGLSYYQLRRTTDAIVQFETLRTTNPENEEVALILKNLRAGRAPFANAEPPVTPNPEKRSSPPIRQSR